MKFYLIVAKGKKQGMPIPVEIDLFLIGSQSGLPTAGHLSWRRRAALRRDPRPESLRERSGQWGADLRRWRNSDSRASSGLFMPARFWKSARSNSWFSTAKRLFPSVIWRNGP